MAEIPSCSSGFLKFAMRGAVGLLHKRLLFRSGVGAGSSSLFVPVLHWYSSRSALEDLQQAAHALAGTHTPPPPLPRGSGSSRRGKRTRAWQLGHMTEGLAANIVRAGNLVLRQEAEDVPASMLGTDKLRDTVRLMMDTMRAAPGVGLAAPQIGIPLKVRNPRAGGQYACLHAQHSCMHRKLQTS